MRLLLFFGLIYLLYLVIKSPSGTLFGGTKTRTEKMKSPKNNPPKLEAEEMAACALCGTFISKKDGEMRGGQFVCKPSCHH